MAALLRLLFLGWLMTAIQPTYGVKRKGTKAFQQSVEPEVTSVPAHGSGEDMTTEVFIPTPSGVCSRTQDDSIHRSSFTNSSASSSADKKAMITVTASDQVEPTSADATLPAHDTGHLPEQVQEPGTHADSTSHLIEICVR